MSEVLASLKKIGGSGEQYTETVLWTNPSPTADFAAQTVTLSDSIGNYKYIGIKYCYSKQITDMVYTAIYKTEDLRASVLDNGTTHNVIILGIENASNYGYGRFVGYLSDTSIKFTLAYRLNAAGSASNTANPLEILGINELAHQTVGERYDVLPAVTVNAGTKPTFTTKGQAKAIFMTYMVANGTVAYTLTNVNPYTGEYDNADLYRTATNSSEITHVGNGNPFIVTDNTITTTLPQSSSQQTKHIMSYTY